MEDDGAELDRLRPGAEHEQRVDHSLDFLTVPEGDTAFGQIVRGKFHGDPIAGKNPDTVAAQTARQMGQYYLFMFQLYAE